ncbi:MAG: hypothetical protein WAT21_13435 [Saprospiraceae bacterium]
MKNKIWNLVMCFIVTIICNAVNSQVIIHSELNYRGTRQTVSVGEGISLPFNVRSITIPNGYLVIMANEEGCTGLCQYWRNMDGSRGLLGARGCTITVKRIDASDARIQVSVKTGGDDLRSGSYAIFHWRINGVGIRSKRIVGAGGSLAGNSKREFSILIPGVRIDQILDMTLAHSGKPAEKGNLFEHYDNWDLAELQVKYICNTYPDGMVVYRGSGSPLVRFTGENKRFPISVLGFACN